MELTQATEKKFMHKLSKKFRTGFWYLKTNKNYQLLLGIAGVVVLFVLTNKQASTSSVRAPVIAVFAPTEQTMISDQQVFVKGKVTPADAEVTINNTGVAKNGNGEFTAMVTIPVGKSLLTFKSSFQGKLSSMILPVERKRTPEEQLAYEQKQARDKALEDQKVMGLKDEVENRVNSLQNAQPTITITSQQVATIGAQRRITGQVKNASNTPAYDVRVIATFFDSAHAVVDIKDGQVTDGPMQPGQTLSYTTTPTAKYFTTYELSVDAKSQPAQDAEASPTPAAPTIPSYTMPN